MKSLTIASVTAMTFVLASCATQGPAITIEEAITKADLEYQKDYGSVPGKPQLVEVRPGNEDNVNVTLRADEAYTAQLNNASEQAKQAEAAAACNADVRDAIAPIGLEVWIVDSRDQLLASARCE